MPNPSRYHSATTHIAIPAKTGKAWATTQRIFRYGINVRERVAKPGQIGNKLEPDFAKVGVVSSNLIARSSFRRNFTAIVTQSSPFCGTLVNR